MEMSAYIWLLNMDTKRLECNIEVSPFIMIYSNLAQTIISPSVKEIVVIATNEHDTGTEPANMKVIFIRQQKNLLLFLSLAPRRISGRNLSSLSY